MLCFEINKKSQIYMLGTSKDERPCCAFSLHQDSSSCSCANLFQKTRKRVEGRYFNENTEPKKNEDYELN